MKLPHNVGDVVPTYHLLSANEVSNTGTGLHPVEFLAKVIPRKSPNNPDCSQDSRLLHKLTARFHCCRQYPHNLLKLS